MKRALLFALPVTIVAACAGDDEAPVVPPAGATTSSAGGGGGSSTATTGGGGEGGRGGQGGDGGAGGEGGGCEGPLPVSATPPMLLSETGLYDDIATKTVSAHALPYAPQYPLWSDGVEKERWLYLPDLPACAIDNADDDAWEFPVGARAWKEFRDDGERLETRLVLRYGPGSGDVLFATYRWREDESDADLWIDGEEDWRSSNHDIPPQEDCAKCHGGHPFGGVPSRFLGVSAIQLSHDGPGLTMQRMSDDGLLSVPRPQGYPVPGDATAQAALGYLHANCGNCHNDTSEGLLFPQMNLRLSVTETTVEGTALYQETVNQVPDNYGGNGCTHRIAGGSTAGSCIYERMNDRMSVQMPMLATEIVDPTGLAALEAWIHTLPPPN